MEVSQAFYTGQRQGSIWVYLSVNQVLYYLKSYDLSVSSRNIYSI